MQNRVTTYPSAKNMGCVQLPIAMQTLSTNHATHIVGGDANSELYEVLEDVVEAAADTLGEIISQWWG